jgi:hypothetical protein
LFAAICIAGAGFMLLTQYPVIDVEHSAIAHAAGLVLIGLGALVAAGPDRK